MAAIIKNKKILAVLAAVVLILIAAIFAVQSQGAKFDPAAQLSIGQKFLEELDYDNAILTFSKIIEVEPMNAQAYLGLADAYVGKGDTAAAIDALQKGYDATGDAEIKARLDELTKAMVPQVGYPTEIQALFSKMYAYYLAEDYQAAFALQRSVEFKAWLVSCGKDFRAEWKDREGAPALTVSFQNERVFVSGFAMRNSDEDRADGPMVTTHAYPADGGLEEVISKGTSESGRFNGLVEVTQITRGENSESIRIAKGMAVDGDWDGDVIVTQTQNGEARPTYLSTYAKGKNVTIDPNTQSHANKNGETVWSVDYDPATGRTSNAHYSSEEDRSNPSGGMA